MIVRVRRGIGAVVAGACLCLAGVGVGAPGASALTTRQVARSFDGSNGTGQPVVAVAVGNSGEAGDVYVGLASGSVLKFSFSSVHEKYEAEGKPITGAKTPQGSFSLVKGSLTSGIAVDSSETKNAGDVYVADVEHGVVDRFNEKGKYRCQITGSATPSVSECDPAGSGTPAGSIEPRGLAVNSEGDLYVADVVHGVIDEFGPKGEYLGQLVDPKPEPGAIALDASGDVYVVNGEASFPLGVVEFAPNGSVLPRPELEAAAALSVAVDPHSGDVLLGEPLFAISEFPAVAGPKTASFGAGADALAFAKGGQRLYANASTQPTITVYGELEVIPDEVRTGVATGVAPESATLNGELTPATELEVRESTQCGFEYGQTTGYGGVAKCEPGPAYPAGANQVYATVSGLLPGTTYHFRLEAEDAGASLGKTHGADATFTTPARAPLAPVISAEAANPSVTTAMVRSRIAPSGSSASCVVRYVEEAQFETSGYAGAASAPCTGPGLGEGYSAQQALASLEGLRAGTVYHYRFVATNVKNGTSEGEDRTFATFGIQEFSAQVLDSEGHPYTQAGGHPYKLVTNFEFNVGTDVNGHRATDANPDDIITALPPGYIGNVNATPRCTFAELVRAICTREAQVGVIHLRLDSEEDVEPLFNLVPPAGYPAALGFRISTFVSVAIRFKVRTGSDYGIDAESVDSSTSAGLEGATVEVWGVPDDPSHNHERDCKPPGAFGVKIGQEECSVTEPLVPFLTNPTSCSGPQTETLRADSWQDPGNFVTASTTLPGMTGCGVLPFAPEVSVAPTSSSADAPTGLVTNIDVPHDEGREVEQSELKQTVVTLPAGMTVSPSGANGLQACSPEQIAMNNASEPSCPDASRLGSVEIETPVLPDMVKGSVYLAQQNQNPFGSTLALYLYAQADGAVVKLAGHVESDPQTGQLTTTFSETPQLPFSSLKLILEGGPRAALATPESCGTFATDISLTPWSAAAPLSFASPFAVVSWCGGGFAPSFTAGSSDVQAGAYTPLVFSFSRNDGEQELSGLTATLPAGLAAKLAGVPLCSDAAASGGACPEESRVGTVTAYAGPGSDPLVLHGSAYLTGPYKGAPYGMAVEVPAIAGPFNLGTVTVRQALFVDPHDAHVTAVSDSFPRILDVTGANGQTDGLPVRLRRVDVSIDRPQFTFNPTNCTPMTIGATFTSTGGASASTSAPFQVAGCATLPFHPTLEASTQGQASKADGASLTVKVTSQGLGVANIQKVFLTIPKILPSRLQPTLQHACLAAVFEANPGGCDEDSLIGYATVRTPILKSPLTGPAYVVSHGGAAFPDVEFVLQAEGVEIILDGKTDIKDGVTYSRFDSAPDAPFTSFETSLPAGPHSIFAVNTEEAPDYDLCTHNITIPTVITAQDGAVLEQDTKVAATGCSGVLSSKTTRAQLLARALKACKKDKKKAKRAACEKAARKRYGPKKKSHGPNKKAHRAKSRKAH